MEFSQAVIVCLRKYVTFSGRARRAEYWWWALFIVLASIAVGFVEGTINGFTGENVGLLNAAFSLATFLPGLSVLVRRLHDTNRSGWWWFVALIPVVGLIILLVWLVSSGDQGPNDYGPDPLSDDDFDPRGGGGDDDPLHRSNVPSVRRR